MKRVATLLSSEMRHDVPHQDLRIEMVRMPAVPRSRFVMTNVRVEPAGAARATASA
jgi:fatty-acid peroxygenase